MTLELIGKYKYIDNVEEISSGVSGNLCINATELRMGINLDGSNFFNQFKGMIDEVKIWNYEISPAERQAEFDLFNGYLVGHYALEGNANDDTRNYDGTASNVTYEYGLGFQPDLIWFKTRTQAYDHNLTDSTRGTGKQLRPNRNIAEVSATDLITSFDTGGFTVGSGGDANNNDNDTLSLR